MRKTNSLDLKLNLFKERDKLFLNKWKNKINKIIQKIQKIKILLYKGFFNFIFFLSYKYFI